MQHGRRHGKTVRRPFAVFVLFAALLILSGAMRAAEPTAAVKHQAAAQFARAEQQRAALNIKAAAKRTLASTGR